MTKKTYSAYQAVYFQVLTNKIFFLGCIIDKHGTHIADDKKKSV